MSTLGYERGPSDIGRLAIYRRMLASLDEAYEDGRIGGDNAALALTRAHAAVDVLVWHCQRSVGARLASAAPGPEGSIDKLLMIRTEQELLHIAVDLLGTSVWTGGEPEWLHSYIWSRAASIYGGTEQIQKGIVATRVLGLPRDRP
jgi:alkylation response protein AidB-like acyl-CoA dehydrogenase